VTACGNGIVTAGEACDDADLADGDGCSAACAIEPGWRCNGRPSVCSEVCGDTILTPGEQCDDGNTVGRDGCSPGCRFELCTAAPATGCRQPTQSQKAAVTLKHQAFSTSDLALWKWTSGAATSKADFGNPGFDTSYALCVYDDADGAARLRASATAPAGGFCGRAPCWRDKGTSLLYSRHDLLPEGIAKIALVPGGAGSAKIMVKGKGPGLLIPSPSSLVTPVRVQLRNSAGLCWEAQFSAPVAKQTPDLFKDKSD
jgi:cysteine-rich repeat protein